MMYSGGCSFLILISSPPARARDPEPCPPPEMADAEPFVRRELFGGAITAELPERLVDVSDFRPVPDNQEVGQTQQGRHAAGGRQHYAGGARPCSTHACTSLAVPQVWADASCDQSLIVEILVGGPSTVLQQQWQQPLFGYTGVGAGGRPR
jgi:hypothetical protein